MDRFINRFLVGALIVMSFAAFCGTAFGQELDARYHGAVITGILHDGTNPILSTPADGNGDWMATPGARVTIYRRNGEWNEFVATTDCENDRGCVADASGRFWFVTDQNGAIIRPGRVIIAITYDRGFSYENVSISSPYLELAFEYELRPGLNDLGVLPVKALVRLTTDRSNMSNPAGGLEVPFKVANVTSGASGGRIVVQLKAMVSAVGPTGWTNYFANIGIVELEAGLATERTLFVPLTEIVVNGFGVYGMIDAIDYANPWRSFGRVYFSVPKYN